MVDGKTAKPHFLKFMLVKFHIGRARDDLRRIQQDLSLPVDDVTDALLASAALVQEAARIYDLLIGALYNDERAESKALARPAQELPPGATPPDGVPGGRAGRVVASWETDRERR